MLLFADHPRAASFLPDEASLQRRNAAELGTLDRELWHALSPESDLWVAELATTAVDDFWSRAVIIEHADHSQYDGLAEFLRTGGTLVGPVACIALTGDDFHGHRGRPWSAVRGNLHLSVGMQPGRDVRLLVPALSMLPAVAVVAAVRAVTRQAVQPGIKWVNDILVDDDKLAGVLTSTQTKASTVEAAVLGIGLNVAQAPVVVPTPFVPSAGCLATLLGAQTPSLVEVFWSVLAALADEYRQLLDRGPASLLAAYRNCSMVVGEQVRIWDEGADPLSSDGTRPPPLVQGIVEAIESDLTLRVKGHDETVSKGRLALERMCRQLGL